MKALDLLSEAPITIEPCAAIENARQAMEDHHIRHLPVVRDGRLVGLVSDRDVHLAEGILRRSAHKKHPSAGNGTEGPTHIDQIMSSPVHCIGADAHLGQVVETMLLRKISALPVTNNDGLIYIITKTDLVRWFKDFCGENPGHESTTAKVNDCMGTRLISAGPDDTARTVVSRMTEACVQHLPIVDHGKVVGIISDRDLRQTLGITVRNCDNEHPPLGPEHDGIRAKEIMTRNPQTVHPDDRVIDAADTMLNGKFGSLPVVTGGGTLAGIVTDSDIVQLVRSSIVATVA